MYKRSFKQIKFLSLETNQQKMHRNMTKKTDQVTSLTQGLIHRLPATQRLASPRVQFECPTNNGRMTVGTQTC